MFSLFRKLFLVLEGGTVGKMLVFLIIIIITTRDEAVLHLYINIHICQETSPSSSILRLIISNNRKSDIWKSSHEGMVVDIYC